MLSDIEITEEIHRALLAIWQEEISIDYDSGWLLKEDTLKNALYFHLRKRLEKMFDDNDIRIITEFTDGEFVRSGFRPDMVIARVDMDSTARYWGNAVTKCLAVIEIKYKNGFAANKCIYADYEKLKKYIEVLGSTVRLYMATIWECEDDPTPWLDKDAPWAKGRVTELNASYARGEAGQMQFYPFEH